MRGGRRRPKGQSSRGAGEKTQKSFLQDILSNGPAPATLVTERGKARGFTEMQIRYARRQMNIVSFKETGKYGGCWYWVLAHDNRGIPAPQTTPAAYI